MTLKVLLNPGELRLPRKQQSAGVGDERNGRGSFLSPSADSMCLLSGGVNLNAFVLLGVLSGTWLLMDL